VALVVGESFFDLMGRRGKRGQINRDLLERILIVRLDEIGDIVMTSPLLRELRRLLPKTRITVVVKPQLYDLVSLCPYVDEVLTYDLAISTRRQELELHGRALRLAFKHLWRRGYDLAIVPRWGIDFYHAGFIAYFSGAPLRLGYSVEVSSDKKEVSGDRDKLFTHLLTDHSPKHEVERNLEIIRYLGGEVNSDKLELWFDKEDERFAENVVRPIKASGGELLVAIAPGAGSAKRMWPLSHYVEVARWLKKEFSARVLIIGGAGEEHLGHQMESVLGKAAFNVTGETSLRQTGALLKQCDFYIGNDTGPMHLAAGVGIPVIEISCHQQGGLPDHPNSPRTFGPWGVRNFIVQPSTPRYPCVQFCAATEAHCILGVDVETVKRAVTQMVQKKANESFVLSVNY
jgi:heptosyltransferase-2